MFELAAIVYDRMAIVEGKSRFELNFPNMEHNKRDLPDKIDPHNPAPRKRKLPHLEIRPKRMPKHSKKTSPHQIEPAQMGSTTFSSPSLSNRMGESPFRFFCFFCFLCFFCFFALFIDPLTDKVQPLSRPVLFGVGGHQPLCRIFLFLFFLLLLLLLLFFHQPRCFGQKEKMDRGGPLERYQVSRMVVQKVGTRGWYMKHPYHAWCTTLESWPQYNTRQQGSWNWGCCMYTSTSLFCLFGSSSWFFIFDLHCHYDPCSFV